MGVIQPGTVSINVPAHFSPLCSEFLQNQMIVRGLAETRRAVAHPAVANREVQAPLMDKAPLENLGAAPMVYAPRLLTRLTRRARITPYHQSIYPRLSRQPQPAIHHLAREDLAAVAQVAFGPMSAFNLVYLAGTVRAAVRALSSAL